MKNIILFDLDGTLTPARGRADWSMVNALRSLSEHADIGIVSGSSWEYIKEQTALFWEFGAVPVRKIKIMPCNGTQLYEFHNSDFKLISCLSMKEYLDDEEYKNLIAVLCTIQSQYLNDNKSLPVTGNFISFRKSLINWCPIGRDAEDSDREEFVKADHDQNIRKKFKELIIAYLDLYELSDKLEVVIGGNTSIDIYPIGWDKRISLSHLPASQLPWFVGDRCTPGGNDYSLYSHLVKTGRAYETSGPSQTIEIINNIISSIKKT